MFFCKKIFICKKEKGVERLTQEQLRTLYIERLKSEKQGYIAEKVNINQSILSRFKTGKIDLYPELFERLANYLI